MLTDKTEIESFLKTYFEIMGTYTISDEGIVDITGIVKLIYEKFNTLNLTELPIQFGYITRDFLFERSNISTLKGFPYTAEWCSIKDSYYLKSLEFSPKCNQLFCSRCNLLESIDGLNCEIFNGWNNLTLKRFGINFTARWFKFNNFPTPTADEMRKFIRLNPQFSTEQKAPWIQLIKDYYEHKDIFKAISEFEELYNEPWAKPSECISIDLFSNLDINL